MSSGDSVRGVCLGPPSAQELAAERRIKASAARERAELEAWAAELELAKGRRGAWLRFLPWWGFAAAATALPGMAILLEKESVIGFFVFVIAGGAVVGGVAKLLWGLE